MKRRHFLRLAAGAAALGATHARAQADWPARNIRFVIPFPPGGGGDVVCRAAADKTGEILKQPVIVENRTGGNAVIAATLVAQSAPDGYTYLWEGNNHLTNRLLVKDLAIDYQKAFAPVMLTARFPQVIAVRIDFPAQNFDDFVKYCKANPGKVSCGTPPAGGAGHLALALLQRLGDFTVVHTPYKGGPDATRDLMGGQIDSVFLTTSTIRPALQAGKARVIAVSSAQRVAMFPEVPTIAERYPGYDMDDWNGLFAPAGTPPAIIARINGAVTQALKDPSIVEKIAPTGTVLAPNTTAEFAVWLAKQRETMEKTIRDANIVLTS
ncbi:MAG: tripartite tricarboxylate transporter substrate binding protein [Burkholderiales bacterium]